MQYFLRTDKYTLVLCVLVHTLSSCLLAYDCCPMMLLITPVVPVFNLNLTHIQG